ncbi:hypothetical protein ACFWCM_12555 [Streptomyces albidoflavus]|uniref:hypothetical protein n=1 Tax=Streptomyces TaxID=1883 RepID=UPI002F917A1C|nr:hypothetical protein OH810_31895 [Streptomyces albidoflavus]
MNHLAKALTEDIPTGNFGGQRPTAWTPAEQAQHLADLTAALDAIDAEKRRARQAGPGVPDAA